MANIKALITFFGLAAMLIANPAVIFAQTASPSPSLNPRQTQRLDERMTRLHQRCDTEISTRLTNLNNLNNVVGQLKKLSPSQVLQFQTEIRTDITNLTNLKTKCDADTNPTTLISDIKSIFTSYRVYAVFMPQVRLLAAADRTATTVDLFNDYSSKLAYRINAQGNPANLVSLLNDMNAKIADAKTQYTNAINLVSPLSPSSYPGSNPALISARTDLKTAYQDLRASFADAKQIRQGLKSLGGTSITSSPSPTATP